MLTSPARAAQRHLLSVWADIPIGTRVIVRNWAHSTETMSGPYVNSSGVACIRLAGWNGVEIALDRVSLAGPRAVTVADAIQTALPDPSSSLGVGDFVLTAIGLIGGSVCVGWALAWVAVAVTAWVAP